MQNQSTLNGSSFGGGTSITGSSSSSALVAQVPAGGLVLGNDAKNMLCKICRKLGIKDPRKGGVFVAFKDGVCFLCIEASASYKIAVEELEVRSADAVFRQGLFFTIAYMTKMKEKTWNPMEVRKERTRYYYSIVKDTLTSPCGVCRYVIVGPIVCRRLILNL